MSAPVIHHAAVNVFLASGRSGGQGAIEFAQLTLIQRLAKATPLFLVGLGGGVLLVFVPLLHLLGVFFFLALTGLAVKRLGTRRVLRGASGTCPGCSGEGRFFVGFGGRGVKFPIKTNCKHCHVALWLWPPERSHQ